VRAAANMEAEVKDMVGVVMVLEKQGEEAVVVDKMVVALVAVLEVKKEVVSAMLMVA